MFKALALGLFSSLMAQLIAVLFKYFADGYWATPELKNFIPVTIMSGISFGGFWYSWFKIRKLK